MIKYALYGVLTGISGGLFYFVIEDLYKLYIKKTHRYATPFISIKQFCNPGLVMGAVLGILRAYYGKPLLYIMY